jgi:hypothetical protein
MWMATASRNLSSASDSAPIWMITSTRIYKTVRSPKAPGGAELVQRLIHHRSGAGSDVLAVDPERRWKDGYRYLDQEWNLDLLGDPRRANKTAGKAR